MRTFRRPLVILVLGWLLVVAAVGTVTYVVVDEAGRGVAQAPAAEALGTASPTASGTPSPEETTETTATPSPSATHTPSASPTRTSAPAPTTRTTTSRSVAPSTSAPPPTRTPTRTPTPSPTPTRTASFTTAGGTVVASCVGSTIRRDSITPRDGWRFETDTEGGRLEVHFKSETDEVELKIACVGGVPTRVGD